MHRFGAFPGIIDSEALPQRCFQLCRPWNSIIRLRPSLCRSAAVSISGAFTCRSSGPMIAPPPCLVPRSGVPFMPSDDAQPLPGLTFAFDRAYQACPPHVRVLPSRQQSPEILRLAAMACTQVSLHDLDEGEAQTIAHLAALARDPVKLEAFI